MSALNAELMNADRPIAVYGATGHTGRFVLQELRRRGLPAVAVARRRPAEWSEAASMPPIPAGGEAGAEAQATPAPVPTVTFRQAALDDAAALDRALAGCAVLINCAGEPARG